MTDNYNIIAKETGIDINIPLLIVLLSRKETNNKNMRITVPYSNINHNLCKEKYDLLTTTIYKNKLLVLVNAYSNELSDNIYIQHTLYKYAEKSLLFE
jgi:hypothetical protein